MSSVRRFQFDESFDVETGARPRPRYGRAEPPPPPPEPEPPPPPPPPTFSEAELAAATQAGHQAGYAEGKAAGRSAGHAQGFAEGHAAGRAEGYAQGKAEIEAQTNARLANATERLAAGVGQLLAERAAGNAMRQDQPLHLALAIVRKLMPELARRGGIAEVEGLVRACLMELLDEPRMIVRVAPDLADAVREQVGAMAASRGFGTRLVIVDEPAMAAGDCRLEWAEGGAERDTARLLNDIDAALVRLIGAPATA